MSRKVISLCIAVVFLLSSGAVFASDTYINTQIPNYKVNIMTAKEIIKEDRLVKHNVQVPEIQGLANKAFEKELNGIIMAKALKDIEEVEKQAKEFETIAKKEGWDIRQYEIFIDYEVKTNREILSFIVNTYMYTGGANGITKVDTYNIDVKGSKDLEIKDLFYSDDYKEIINKEISVQIKKQMESGEVDYFTEEMGFKTISDDQDFYIEDNNLVILFKKYDIAPGYMGTPEFKIPLDTLSYMIRNKSQSKYLPFTGVVKEVTEGDGKITIYLEDKDGKPAYFIITKDTYIIDDAEIKAGSTIVGFYDAEKPMIMIYPPRYSVEVVGLVKEGGSIKVDRFDMDLVSADNMLKLHIFEETEIVLEDGKPFEGELTNRKLVVIYGLSTKSIPAQTTPIKIIVLFEKAVPPIYNFPSVEDAEIIVNGKKIESPKAYTNENGFIMVPIRPVCESLGVSVEWHNDTRSVTLGNGITLSIGVDGYGKMKDSVITLGAAPELRNSRLYVPLDFFKLALIIDDATISKDQIIIK